GRIVQRVETNGGAAITWRYTYDLRGRLVDVQKDGALYEHYDYDGNGNRTLLTTPTGTTAGVYDAQDRLLSYGATTYTYTANGELRTRTDAGGTTTYAYDVRGNLVRVDLPGGDVIQYLVDGQDRRVGKKKNGVLEKAWLYRNQLNPVAELDGAGALVARFVYGARSNVPEYVVRGGVTYRVLSDHLGSPRTLVDVATGVVAWRADFDAWGNRTLIAGAADFVPFGFAAGMFEHETGLTRFGARDYDPTVGRWVSKDPILWSGGTRLLYSYTGEDPINRRDPSGLQVPWCEPAPPPALPWLELLGNLLSNALKGSLLLSPLAWATGDAANDNADACVDVAGASCKGPPGPKSKGICGLERDLALYGSGEHVCQYYCPQDGSKPTLALPNSLACPPTIGFGS
ncbi:MAG: RHS domain-containing protein, partial [Myxococcales bacterium]|nr:RHS domain-containing protein [Myxococcales bacterium]